MKRALLTGITRQDRSYLAEILLAKGYEVHGIKRRGLSFNTSRIDHIYQDPHEPNPKMAAHYGDMTDASNLTRIMQEVRPDEVYNLAAQSHVAVSFEAPENSHVVPAMIQRFHEAVKSGADHVTIWGTDAPMRESLHVDDMAAAPLFVMALPAATYQRETQEMLSHINVGTGQEVTISQLAETVARVTGFAGELRFDTSRPDGAPRKLLDVSRLAKLGWAASIELEAGIRDTYDWFLTQRASDLRAL